MWPLLKSRLAAVALGPWALRMRIMPMLWRRPPFSPQPQLLAEASADQCLAPPQNASALSALLDSILLMAVPKKKVSYTRKRVRQAGQIRARGPFLQSHMSICPVCERMRAPHRVCGREDCRTYFKHRWF